MVIKYLLHYFFGKYVIHYLVWKVRKKYLRLYPFSVKPGEDKIDMKGAISEARREVGVEIMAAMSKTFQQ